MIKPRILIFSVAYEPLVGGAELAVRHITDRLSSFEFDLITCRFAPGHRRKERVGNVNVYRVGFGSRLGRYIYPALAYRLARKLHKVRPYQVVWSIMAAYAGAAALMFKRRQPEVKLLLTLQEGDPIEDHIHKKIRGFRVAWQRIFQKSDYIQAISCFLADWARKEGATCPVEVVPNGVGLDRIKSHEVRSKDKKNIIITTSRLVHKNAVDVLIRSAAILKTLIFDSNFLIRILGAGSEEAKLKKLSRDLGVEKQVEFLGNIEPEQIPTHLAAADIFVRPSRSEGLGSSFLEAMAAGLPVIGTSVGGIPDFLKDGETGLFVKVDDPADLAEKMRLLLSSSDLRHKLGESGKALVRRRYSWEQVGQQMRLIFEKLSI